jgi:glycosyltransferase involved in cell wall biosynthesis
MKIAHALHQGGYAVTLVGWNMDDSQPAFERLEVFPCYRLPVRARFGRGMVNMFHQMRWQIALLNWLVQHQHEYAIIHACDFDTVLAALCCKLLMGKLVVYDIFDFYADMLRATPGFVKTMLRFVDLRAINAADALILADEARYKQISGAHPKRSVVIYNALQDLPVSRQPDPETSPDDSRLRLVYFGNLQVERGLVELLDVLSSHPEWQLDIGGFGGDEALIQAKANVLANVTWHGCLPYERVLALTAQADALIATYDPNIPNNRYASPNKLFEAMLLGKPIIVARGTNMDRIVLETDCGMVIPYGSRVDLESALQTLHSQPGLRRQLGANARRAYKTTYNWQTMQARLLQLYASLPKA